MMEGINVSLQNMNTCPLCRQLFDAVLTYDRLGGRVIEQVRFCLYDEA